MQKGREKCITHSSNQVYGGYLLLNLATYTVFPWKWSFLQQSLKNANTKYKIHVKWLNYITTNLPNMWIYLFSLYYMFRLKIFHFTKNRIFTNWPTKKKKWHKFLLLSKNLSSKSPVIQDIFRSIFLNKKWGDGSHNNGKTFTWVERKRDTDREGEPSVREITWKPCGIYCFSCASREKINMCIGPAKVD